ncbi:AMP-binding protein [Pseudomonas izuensis]|uniref:AMP-binding protein n=1 Tax=Pseudomonas izuensis TaxID=2684212 RepID=UPI001359B3CB|nr:AMP-binding protein [Pseudomonas izuensis]
MENNNTTTLLHRFLHWEQTRPQAIHLSQPVGEEVIDYSWREVGDQARRMAAYLSSLALPTGSSIAILGRNSAHWVIADLAIWMAGHVSVPLYPTMSTDGMAHVLEHANVRLAFVGRIDAWDSGRQALFENIALIALPLAPDLDAGCWDTLIAAHAPLCELELPAPEQLATIIYTSGTTGMPKGVMHSFASMYTYAKLGGGDFCSMTPDDCMLSYLPLAHAAERSCVESNSLCHGARIYFNDSLETFSRDLCRARPTVFISMPRLWTKFYQSVCAKLGTQQRDALTGPDGAVLKEQILGMLGLDRTRIAFTGSAPLPTDIVNWYRSLGLELLEVYGMSENFCYSHYSRPGQVRIGYVGQALPGVECRLSPEGEILVRCATQMLGYYKDPQQTAQSLTTDGFFHTGDRGELDEQGRLKITGRVKELFKTSRGKYVAPAPIENRLVNDLVEAACVTGMGQSQPFALLLLSPTGRARLGDAAGRESLRGELLTLLEQVNASLEGHEKLDCLVVVKDVWTIDNGFLTPTLKIKRTVIEDHYLAHVQDWADSGEPIHFQACF